MLHVNTSVRDIGRQNVGQNIRKWPEVLILTYSFKHILHSHFSGPLMLLLANLDGSTSSAKVSRLSESDDTSTEHLHCNAGCG